MSLDVANAVAYNVTGAYSAYFDDTVGLCVIADGYYIAQLDGTAHRRANARGARLIPEIGTGRAWWLAGYNYYHYEDAFYRLEPANLASGGKGNEEGADPDLLNRVFIIYINEGGIGYTRKAPIAILPDRILFAVKQRYIDDYSTQGTALYEESVWIASLPRSATAPQVLTLEYLLAAGEYDHVFACQSSKQNHLWIGGYRGKNEEERDIDGTEVFYMEEYDYVNRQAGLGSASSVNSLPWPDDKHVIGVSWSSHLKKLVIASSDTIFLLSEDITPAKISEPEVVYPVPDIEIESISTTDPAVLKTRTSLSQMAGGLSTGDRVYVSGDGLFSGFVLRFPNASYHWSEYSYTLEAGITKRTLVCTVIDDRTISVDRDGAAALSYYPGEFNLVGPEGYQHLPYNTKIEPYGSLAPASGMYEGLSVVFYGEVPSGHPITGTVSEILSIRKWNEFVPEEYAGEEYRHRQTAYVLLDRTGWGVGQTYWPVTIEGGFRPQTDAGPFKVTGCTVKKAYETAKIIAFDYREANPIYTVDNPDWLDVLGVTGTTMVQIQGENMGFDPGWGGEVATYEAMATRVAANRFKYHLLDSALVRVGAASSCTLTNEAQAVLGVSTGFTLPFSVGDVIRVSSVAAGGDASVVGALLTIIEVISTGASYRTDLNTTSYGSWTTVNFTYEYATNIKGWAIATALDFTEQYNGDAKEVRARVLGSRNEPCPRRAVSWSASAGTFKQSVTETDEDGYAYALYYPPAGASGDYTITASVDTP